MARVLVRDDQHHLGFQVIDTETHAVVASYSDVDFINSETPYFDLLRLAMQVPSLAERSERFLRDAWPLLGAALLAKDNA